MHDLARGKVSRADILLQLLIVTSALLAMEHGRSSAAGRMPRLRGINWFPGPILPREGARGG